MGTAPQTLIDLAFTPFLSDPDSYEGGELEIEEPAGTRSFKLPAGAAILYPANSVHEVAKVTSGRRDVAVGWIQSLVRDADKRRILFELENLRATIDRKSTRLNSSHYCAARMPSSACKQNNQTPTTHK